MNQPAKGPLAKTKLKYLFHFEEKPVGKANILESQKERLNDFYGNSSRTRTNSSVQTGTPMESSEPTHTRKSTRILQPISKFENTVDTDTLFLKGKKSNPVNSQVCSQLPTGEPSRESTMLPEKTQYNPPRKQVFLLRHQKNVEFPHLRKALIIDSLEV